MMLQVQLRRSRICKTIRYLNAIRCIMYSIVCTRPDLANSVNVASSYIDSLRRSHWQWIKWILMYLKGTLGVGLIYGKDYDVDFEAVGYVDSDYASDRD